MPYKENKSSLELFEEVDTCLDRNIPFVLYKLPGGTEINGIVDNMESTTQDFRFLIHPFANDQKAYSLAFNTVFSTPLEDIPKAGSIDSKSIETDTEGKKGFIRLVEEAQLSISRREFQKVVLSRPVEISIKRNPKNLFSRLVHAYPSAYCYWWYHPSTGHWLGASPELLMSAQNNAIEIMSLAGTRKTEYGQTVAWNEKEKEEQAIVTKYIRNVLNRHGSKITEEGPETVQAGSLVHLGTQLKAILTSSANTVLNELHPTPAICGVPKESALQFIKQHEGYERDLYTGYLGVLSSDPKMPSQLFVNLRCMTCEENSVKVFVGCGITAASDPELEWQETVDKCQTMFNILDISTH